MSFSFTTNNNYFNSFIYIRLSFWLSSLCTFFFVKIPLQLMPKTEHSPAVFVSWEGESWEILGIIALSVMQYANV